MYFYSLSVLFQLKSDVLTAKCVLHDMHAHVYVNDRCRVLPMQGTGWGLIAGTAIVISSRDTKVHSLVDSSIDCIIDGLIRAGTQGHAIQGCKVTIVIYMRLPIHSHAFAIMHTHACKYRMCT